MLDCCTCQDEVLSTVSLLSAISTFLLLGKIFDLPPNYSVGMYRACC